VVTVCVVWVTVEPGAFWLALGSPAVGGTTGAVMPFGTGAAAPVWSDGCAWADVAASGAEMTMAIADA
jgi:hypothetical protein